MSGKSEGDAFKAIDEAMADLDMSAQQRLVTWVNSKFGSGGQVETAKVASANGAKGTAPKAVGHQKSTTGKKVKAVMKVLKDLDLRPKDKETASVFVGKKQPGNNKQKCVVAIYYMGHVLELAEITSAHVYTFFKELNWPLPSNLMNTMHQAGTDGWLDTSNASDLKVTTRGENLVEHDLPPKTQLA